MLFEIHLTIECDSDDFKLSGWPEVAHTKFNLKQSAYLGKVIELYTNLLAHFDKLGFRQRLTALKVLLYCRA